jgi:hypothetical protein
MIPKSQDITPMIAIVFPLIKNLFILEFVDNFKYPFG